MTVTHEFRGPFGLSEDVHIDGDNAIKAKITGVMFRDVGLVQYECSWFHNGGHAQAWIDHWRLERCS